MAEQDLPGDPFATRLDRRRLLKRGAAASAALGLAPYVATSRAFASSRTIKIGWVSPLTGPLEPRAIARLASSSRASVSSALNTLERDGFVARSRSSVDRRLVTVELTERGSDRMAVAFQATNRREQQLVAVFSAEERRTLTELLVRLLVANGS